MNLLCTSVTVSRKHFVFDKLEETSAKSKAHFVAVEILYLDFSYLSN